MYRPLHKLPIALAPLLMLLPLLAGCNDGDLGDAQAGDAQSGDIGQGMDAFVADVGGDAEVPDALAGDDAMGVDVAVDAGGLEADTSAPELCGNGALDLGESCDPAIAAGLVGACPSECAPEMMCSAASLVGSGCDVRCESTPVTACIDDDGCCPDTCNALDDTDCLENVTAWGTIHLTVSTHPSTTVSTASATFVARTATPSSCTLTSDGPCDLYECTTGGPAPTFDYQSAGRVTIRGGASGDLVMSPAGDSTYLPVRSMSSGPEWSPGDSITVAAAGGTIPAFTLASTFPNVLTPLTPRPVMTPTGLCISATRSAGIRFTWSGESVGDAVAGLSQVVGTRSRSLSCRFPAGDRSGTMPAALLGRFSATAGDGTPNTFVSLTYGGKTERVLAGDALVTLYMHGSTGMSAFVDLR